MITVHQTADQYSLEIRRVGKEIGHIQWHPEREPRIVLDEDNDDAFPYLTLDEIAATIHEYQRHRRIGPFAQHHPKKQLRA